MWVNASMMVVSAAAIHRCSLQVIEQDLEKKKSVEGKTGYPRGVFKSYIRCFGQNLCPTVPILNAQYRNLHVESLVWGILSLKAWKWQLSLSHTLQMCAEVMITPCGTAFRGNDL